MSEMILDSIFLSFLLALVFFLCFSLYFTPLSLSRSLSLSLCLISLEILFLLFARNLSDFYRSEIVVYVTTDLYS